MQTRYWPVLGLISSIALTPSPLLGGARSIVGAERKDVGMDELTEEDRAILDLERKTFRYVGAKEKRIREQFGLTALQYFVRLNRLLEQPAALIYAPAVVNRLRDRRTSALGV